MAENKAIPVIISSLDAKLDGKDKSTIEFCQDLVRRYYTSKGLDYANYFSDIHVAAKYGIAEDCYKFVTGHTSTFRFYKNLLRKPQEIKLIGQYGYPVSGHEVADPSASTPKRKHHKIRDQTLDEDGAHEETGARSKKRAKQ